MNYDKLVELTDQLLVLLPNTPVATDLVPDARTIAVLWSGLLTVTYSRSIGLFSDPVVRMAISRHRRLATVINEEVDDAAAVGRRDVRMTRNVWEAVLQVEISRRDVHRQIADLALIQVLASKSELMVDLTEEQQRYVTATLRISCPTAVPVAAVQALRMYRDLGHVPIPWQECTLPDLRESFPISVQKERDEPTFDEADNPADEHASEPSCPPLSLPDIVTGLRKTVISQDDAVREFATCAYRHLLGIRQGAVLVTGPTGVGKTSLATAWGALSNRPVITVDCAALVPEGIRGATIGDALIATWTAAGKDLAKAATAILILDEADKLLYHHQYSLQLRNTLLKLLDGCDWRSFDTEKFERGPRLESFPTHGLLVVMCGSFSDVKETTDRKMGFGVDETGSAVRDRLDLETLVTLADLRGRIGCHVDLRPLDRAGLTAILASDEGPLRSLRQLFPGYRVQLSAPLIDRIVNDALRANVGARGLWPPLRALESRLLFDGPTQPGERHGVQFGWQLRTVGDQLPPSIKEVIQAPPENAPMAAQATS